VRVFHSYPKSHHWERVPGPADLRNLNGRLIIEGSPEGAAEAERWVIALGRFALRGGTVKYAHRPNG